MTVFDDLVAEQDRLEAILDGLDDAQWAAPSGCPGWTITDVVLHLAQSEEAVASSVSGGHGLGPRSAEGPTLDETMDSLVRAQRAAPVAVFQRWRQARRAAVGALRGAAFCRVAAQRLPPDGSGLAISGPHAATALRLLRTYAA